VVTFALPAAFALVGVTLAALAIFAPRSPATPAISFAPPAGPSCDPWGADAFTLASERFAPLEPLAFEPVPPFETIAAPEPVARAGPFDAEARALASAPPASGPEGAPRWPLAVDARAAGCDAAARLALVEALGALCTPWASDVLRRAYDDEPDARVHDAVRAALRRA
jgi:hypothetical protein